MTKTAANVRIGVIGELFYDGDDGTLPTDATTATTGFAGLGYVSDAGLTQSVAASSTDIKAWGGDTVRTVQTEHAVSFSLELLETSAEVLKTFYGDESATDSAVEMTAAQGRRGMWVIDMVDGDYSIRIVIPDGQISATGDVSYITGEALKYPITISCYPDTSGVKAYKYIDDGGA